ncbi:MAG: CDP-diacylglycerol--serine O-phosphatidyltransferase [Smithella sp.]|jgi:CDP-diacylglycerol--serine O-phosphatidyltransferase|nr:CDP-diacylglycerol--serine O-phosphatidyltransferase [Smithella sp. SCADC]MDD5344449.1 CDP-diacylglycerol--serine O-phosphatidyltransferase [Smithella sp.]
MNTENSPQKMRMKKGIYILPNLFTSASLFCGFYSIIASFKEHFVPASIAILFSVVFDGLDGRIARLTNTTSKFGAEYDSLADVIAFGVAPSLLAYSWAMSIYGKWGWIVAFLFVLCGALRLARYNIQIGIIESSVFNGLPIPAAASVVATTVIFFSSDYIGVEGKFHNIFIIIFVIILSLLMVSSIKYYSFKDMKLLVRKPFTIFFWLVVLSIIIVAEPELMFFVIMLGYALSGPIWWVVKFIQKSKEKKINIH